MIDSPRPVPSGGCICAEWPDRKIVPLGCDTANFDDEEFNRICDRTPWLRLVRCGGCGAPWYLAVDTVDDDYYFRRLSAAEAAAIERSNIWPPDYDGFASVWPEPSDLTGVDIRHPWT
jgi:hypothetical protein